MIKNYTYLTMYSGVSFREELPVQENLGNINLYFKFLGVMRSVYDSSIYHQLCVVPNRETNSIIITVPTSDTQQINPGKYIFDVISRCNTNLEIINKVKEGIVYVYPSYGLEAYNKAQKEIL